MGWVIRLALVYGMANHPELLCRADGLLCSLNDRVGAFLALAMGQAPTRIPGTDYGPLDLSIFTHLMEHHEMEKPRKRTEDE